MPRRTGRLHLLAAVVTCAVGASLALAPPASAAAQVISFEGETMALAPSLGASTPDARASGGRTLSVWANAAASKGLVTAAPADRVAVRVRGSQCKGAPVMVVRVDGVVVLKAPVSSTSYTQVAASVRIPAGSHKLAIEFVNDLRTGWCDRNLFVDSAELTTASQVPGPEEEPTSPPVPAPEPAAAPGPEPSANPLATVKLYVDPQSAARRQADAWRASRPADAAQLDKIAGRPQADWFGEWSGDVTASVSRRVETATAAGAVPVLVAYNIPQRDCGSFSAGGLASAEAYRTWIRSFKTGIGTRRAVVILEPDALAMLDCLSAADQWTRLALLKDAVAVLEGQPGVDVYLDAGHSRWVGAAQMASRLTQAGVAQAQGFAANVSNFRPTTELIAYGKEVSARVGGKHFVIDTSRNGLGPSAEGQWCNPSGRALGPAPATSTGDPAVDAYLWIKNPGESDGTCNGGLPAGTFWADYALGLAQRTP